MQVFQMHFFWMDLDKHLKSRVRKQRKREEGGELFQSVPNRTSPLPIFCQLAVGRQSIVQYGGLCRTIIITRILVQQRKRDKGETVRILCAVWRNGKLCVLGIHVTALLKNASKQLQNSRDSVWAHKVVTTIQTSVVRMGGGEGCCLWLRV